MSYILIRILQSVVLFFCSGLFRGLRSCNIAGTIGELRWSGNLVAFMDTMLQIALVSKDTRLLFVPTSLDEVVIDCKEHREIIGKLAENETVPVYYFKDSNIIKYVTIFYKAKIFVIKIIILT